MRIETIRELRDSEPKPTAAYNFRAMLRKLDESLNATDSKSVSNARSEAKMLGRDVVRTFIDSSEPEKAKLRADIDIMTILRPDITRDVYYLLLGAKVAPATTVRSLLSLRPHGSIPTKRAGIY